MSLSNRRRAASERHCEAPQGASAIADQHTKTFKGLQRCSPFCLWSGRNPPHFSPPRLCHPEPVEGSSRVLRHPHCGRSVAALEPAPDLFHGGFKSSMQHSRDSKVRKNEKASREGGRLKFLPCAFEPPKVAYETSRRKPKILYF